MGSLILTDLSTAWNRLHQTTFQNHPRFIASLTIISAHRTLYDHHDWRSFWWRPWRIARYMVRRELCGCISEHSYAPLLGFLYTSFFSDWKQEQLIERLSLRFNTNPRLKSLCASGAYLSKTWTVDSCFQMEGSSVRSSRHLFSSVTSAKMMPASLLITQEDAHGLLSHQNDSYSENWTILRKTWPF